MLPFSLRHTNRKSKVPSQLRRRLPQVEVLEARWLPSTLTVNGTANLFGAGHAAPPAPGGGGAGQLPPVFRFTPKAGQVLTFSAVAGTVAGSVGAAPNGPDGADTSNPPVGVDIASFGGISGIKVEDRTMFLAGVFLSGNEPIDPAPLRMHFVAEPYINLEGNPDGGLKTLSPELNQTFYIGDGRRLNGVIENFLVPADASRLYLGFIDGNSPGLPGDYADNRGALTAQFAITSPNPQGLVQPTSYDMPNGISPTSQTRHYWDKFYTGSGNTTQDAAPLSGGLGDLTDGVATTQNWPIAENVEGTGPYVGWKNANAPFPVPNPTITFHFDRAVDFGIVRVHVDDSNGAGGVLPPGSVTIQVGSVSRTFSVIDPADDDPLWLEFDVSKAGMRGDTLTMTLNQRAPGTWVFVDEVQFESKVPDLLPTSLAWNAINRSVDFYYRVNGADLPQDTTVALYWQLPPAPSGPLQPVSYDMPNGIAPFALNRFYWDQTYSGFGDPAEDGAPLYGGSGDLTDGVVTTQNWPDAESLGGTGPYVGWKNTNAPFPVPNPTITFHFADVATFERIRVHVDDSNGAGGVVPPGSVTIRVGNVSRTFTVADPPGGEPHWLEFDVSGLGMRGDTVFVTLNQRFVANNWVFADEVEFIGRAETLGPPIFTTTVNPLLGQHGPIRVPFSVIGTPPPGATRLLVVTDPGRLVAESNEANNVRSLALPDLLGTSFHYRPSGDPNAGLDGPVTLGTPIDILAQVRNGGLGDAGRFRVRFYASRDATITTGDVLLGEVTVDGLAAGASKATGLQNRILSRYITWSGPVYLGMILDPLNQLPRIEVTRANNANRGAGLDLIQVQLSNTTAAQSSSTVPSSSQRSSVLGGADLVAAYFAGPLWEADVEGWQKRKG